MTASGRVQLPPELNSAIMGFCPPGSLRHLPLVNKEFRFHAEKLLYAHVAVRASKQWQVGVFETLATDTTKAGYVKFLSLEFDGSEYPTDSLVVERLVSSAPALKNLKDLRIRLRDDLEMYTADVFSMLCAGYFHLNTLFVDDYFDFGAILEAQNRLTVLGVFEVMFHYGGTPSSLVRSVKDRSVIAVYLEDTEGELPTHEELSLTPELLSLGHARDFDFILGKALESDDMTISPRAEQVTHVSVYLKHVPSKEIFKAFIDAAGRLFVNLRNLELVLRSSDDTLEEWRDDPVAWPRSLTELEVIDTGVPISISQKRFRGSTEEFTKFLHTFARRDWGNWGRRSYSSDSEE
ncbi:hypothetical protein DFP72DRAFT_922243 [Ephemerocybe angulata]|uniref:F-box domain-containing protein n=1 Tax=Ephemerocybe angulata TaxID=980116 RepID=A0A8H6LWQ7_9AGAR|nr:hypothetical protein DFP72DRAFT_922243 [Tulosesus angulatus]